MPIKSIYKDVLYPYQKEAASRIAKQKRVLLADQPGLGKTLEVLAALEIGGMFEGRRNILILTPVINAQTTWKSSIQRWILPLYPEVNLIDVSAGNSLQKAKQFEHASALNIVLANHNAIDMTKGSMRVEKIRNLSYEALIVDESHLVLPIRDARQLTQFRQGLHAIPMSKSCWRVAISGTPDRGKLENRFGTWHFLEPIKFGTQRDWLAENFHIFDQRVSRTKSIKVVGPLKSEDNWLAKDRELMIRRTKHEVLPQLPQKRYVDVELDLSKEQKLEYFAQQMVSERKMAESTKIDGPSGEAMIFALRARQIATCQWDREKNQPIVGGASTKFEWLKEWLDERGFFSADEFADESAKVVIVSQFSKVLGWLKQELGKLGLYAEILDGEVNAKRRGSIQHDFQHGELRVVLLSGNMGVGIDLDSADDLILLDLPYDPDRVEQIEDRVHRASNMHQVTIWTLIGRDTIDMAIMEKVSSRYQITRAMMDGSRGINFSRQIVKLIK